MTGLVTPAAAVAVTLDVRGQPSADPLSTGLSEIDGVFEVTTVDLDRPAD
jgi:hypothetical protein